MKFRSQKIAICACLICILLAACSKSEQETEKVNQADVDIWQDVPYEPTQVDMQLKQISSHVYFVQGPPGAPTDNDGFMSNAGVVITDEGVVVFDALGTPSLAHLFLSKIRAITNQPVRKVIVSHYHADHIYGLQVFQELGAEIIAPLGAKDYLSSDSAPARLNERRESLFPWVDEHTKLVTPDRFIDKPTTFKLGRQRFTVIPLGSTHSNGDLMLSVENQGVLFCGDLIFKGRIPFVAGSNPDLWLKHLQILDTSKLKAIIPGHGPASNTPLQAVTFTKEYLQYLQDHMGAAVEDLIPFDEAYSSVDWRPYENLPAFMANRMNAYYVYLRLEEKSVN